MNRIFLSAHHMRRGFDKHKYLIGDTMGDKHTSGRVTTDNL